MTPTANEQLEMVRKAAERLYDWTLQRGHPDKGRFGINPWNLDDTDIAYGKRDDAGMLLALYALRTIPPYAHLPITAEWLREAWGFHNVNGPFEEEEWRLPNKEPKSRPTHYWLACMYQHNGKWLLTADSSDGRICIEEKVVTSRLQLHQLMTTALGIEPKGEGV